MDGLIQFIIITIFVFRIASWLSRTFGSGTNQKKQGTNPLEQLKKQLEQETHQKPEPQPVKTPPKRVPRVRQRIRIPEAQSLEITEAPYSNLEKGILDQTHRSKFSHHKKKRKTTITDNNELLDDFDARKAFVYSEIFNRKHFKL